MKASVIAARLLLAQAEEESKAKREAHVKRFGTALYANSIGRFVSLCPSHVPEGWDLFDASLLVRECYTRACFVCGGGKL